MPQPMFQVLAGTVNGVNLTFSFSAPYTPGTTAIYRNGQLLLNSGGNPWTETSPATGVVTIHLEELPKTGDQIAGFALDTSDPAPETVIEGLRGIMVDIVEGLQGSLADVTVLTATVRDMDALVGVASDVAGLSGVLADIVDGLTGTMEDC